jgi:hypothetical protein
MTTSFFESFKSPKSTATKTQSTKMDAKMHQSGKESKVKRQPVSRKLKPFERLTLEMTEKQAKRPIAEIMSDFFESAFCFIGVARSGYKVKFCYRSKITMYMEDEETGELIEHYVIGKYSENFQSVFAKYYPDRVSS